MLNKEKHQLIMGQILRDIYSDTAIAPLLGFKGGTCAYLFYDLPRFSVDLDFDLLFANGDVENTKKLVFVTIGNILPKYGVIKDSYIKFNTIFFLLSYGDVDHNIKIEINTRRGIVRTEDRYSVQEYLGIVMLVAKKPYMFSSKLVALTTRTNSAMRDVYDVWYFLKNHFDALEEYIKEKTNKDLKSYLTDCILHIENIKDNQILSGLGELLDEKQKIWVKTDLRKEVVFLLKNYQSVLK